MTTLNYKLDTTNDLLTSRAGLLAVAELMNSIGLYRHIDQHFPASKSNRAFKPSQIIQTFILMQYEGSFHLDDVRLLRNDEALCKAMDIKQLPAATTLREALRYMGKFSSIQDCWVKVNHVLLRPALHQCKKVTLDIDATEVITQEE